MCIHLWCIELPLTTKENYHIFDTHFQRHKQVAECTVELDRVVEQTMGMAQADMLA